MTSPASHAPFISAQNRARVVTIFLIVGAVISALLICVEVAQLAFPEFTEGQEFADNPGGLFALLSYTVLTLLSFVVFIITAVVFLMWLHRCSSNLPAFGHWKSHGYSPAWTVGSFFVPFVNLVVPYQAVKEIWQKSHPADSQSFSLSNSPPGFFPAWWGFWIAADFAINIHFRMSGRDAPRDATIIVGIVGSALSIAAAAFAIQVVKEIARRQEETIKHVRPGEQLPTPPPPPIF